MDKAHAPIQYLVSEDGQRTGVVLDWEAYLALQQGGPSADPEILVGLSQAELQALSAGLIVAPQQERLRTLLDRNRDGQLGPDETRELDSLLERVDSLNTLKARAHYTLHQLGLAA